MVRYVEEITVTAGLAPLATQFRDGMRMDPVNPPEKTRRGLLFYVGSAGLLCMMLVEAAAVIGRHLGMPLMGALEIVQAAIVPAACAAMLIATLRGAHAAVHLVTERLPPRRCADG